MTSLLALVIAQCFVVDDSTSGWKRVELPADAPRLAASAGIAQFRGDEPVTEVVDELSQLLASTDRRVGRATFSFSLPASTQQFSLEFARPLDGAKVDVDAFLGGGVLRLVDEKRIGGTTLAVTVPTKAATTLRVTVHHHFRDAPALAAARAERQGLPRELGFSPELARDHALYVLAPAGGLTLCERRDAAWRVNAVEVNEPVVVRVGLKSHVAGR